MGENFNYYTVIIYSSKVSPPMLRQQT